MFVEDYQYFDRPRKSDAAYLVKVLCAGIRILEEEIFADDLSAFKSRAESLLKRGELTITFGSGQQMSVSEICIDVYELPQLWYRHDLSIAFKR